MVNPEELYINYKGLETWNNARVVLVACLETMSPSSQHIYNETQLAWNISN